MIKYYLKLFSMRSLLSFNIVIYIILAFYLIASFGVVQANASDFYAGKINGLVWSEDSKLLYAGSENEVTWYQISYNRKFDKSNLHIELYKINAFAIDFNNSNLTTIRRDGKLKIKKIVGIKSGKPSLQSSGTKTTSVFKFADELAISHNGKFIGVGDCEGRITLFDKYGNKKWDIINNDKCINAIIFDKSNKFLVTAGDDGRIRLFDIATGKQVEVQRAHGKGVAKIIFSPTSNEIISAGKDGKIKRWSLPGLKKIAEYSGHKNAIKDIAITLDGRFLASGGNNNVIIIHDLIIKSIIGRIEVKANRVTNLAISPDGHTLAWAGSDKFIHLYDLYDIDSYAALNSMPCNLSTSVAFDDSKTFDPNYILNASESEAIITTTTINDGEGSAFGVSIELTCNNNDIILEKKTENIGTLFSGQSSVTQWKLKVKTQASNGKVDFSIITTESQKRDARPILLPLQIEELVPPVFELTAVEWNDGRTGQARGNNNKIPENGETVELTLFIKNSGKGRSQQAQAEISFKHTLGLSVLNDVDILGEIRPGETRPVKFLIRLSKNFRASKLVYDFAVNDKRDIPGLVLKDNAKDVKHNTPYLVATILKPSEVTNGKSYKVSVLPKNIGSLSASDVSIKFSFTYGIIAHNAVQQVGTIDIGKTGGEQTVHFDVPRNFSGSEIKVSLSVQQDLGFEGIDTTFIIPVKNRTPKLDIDARLNLANMSIQQGEIAVMKLLIHNKGDIDAANVKVRIKGNRSHVSILPNIIDIGTILANSSAEQIPINISVAGGESSGSLEINIDVSQDEFSGVTDILNLNIIDRDKLIAKAPETISYSNNNMNINTNRAPTGGRNSSGVRIRVSPSVKEITVHEDVYRVKAFALSSARGIANFDISVNRSNQYDHTNLEAQAILKDMNNEIFSISDLELPLEVGENIIKIRSREIQTNIISSKEFIVTYKPVSSKLSILDSRGRELFSDIDVEIEKIGKGKFKKNRCAIVIGIEDYLQTGKSKYSRHDAEVFAAYAEHVFGVPEKNIFSYYDEFASNYNLNKMLADGSPISVFLEQNKNNSEILFYYSGHGVPNYTATDEKQSSFILPYDVAPTHEDALKGGLAVGQILHKLQSFSPKMLFVAFDACFMGKSREGKELVEQRPAYIEKTITLDGDGEVSLYATSAGETAIPLAEQYHGLFTYFLLKGLRGAADDEGNNNNKLTVREISNYLEKHIPEYASRVNSKQTAQISSGDPNMVLVELR